MVRHSLSEQSRLLISYMVQKKNTVQSLADFKHVNELNIICETDFEELSQLVGTEGELRGLSLSLFLTGQFLIHEELLLLGWLTKVCSRGKLSEIKIDFTMLVATY